jgi:hypothetical protein
LFERPATEPFGKIFRTEPRIVDQPREAFSRRLLVALRPRQFGLAARLLGYDRRDKGGNGFDLMTVCLWHHFFNKRFKACCIWNC